MRDPDKFIGRKIYLAEELDLPLRGVAAVEER